MTPNQYTIHNIFERLKPIGGPWQDIDRHARPITDAPSAEPR